MNTDAIKARKVALQEAMEREAVEVLVLFGNNWHADHLRYATDFGIQEGQGIAIVRDDGSTTLILDDAAECERARAEAPTLDAIFAPSLVLEVKRQLARAGNHKIAAAPYHLLPFGLLHGEKDLRVSDGASIVDHLLMRKMEVEIASVRRAAKLADQGYAIFRNAARPGRKDYELVAEMEGFFRANGVAENFMIIGVGGVEVRGMAPPSGKILKKGDLVTTELTPCFEGYYAQICRTLVVGEPNDAQRSAFAQYLESMEAGIAAVKAGVTAAHVAKAENDVFRKYGLGEYVTSEYTRVRGHGMGLFPDQKPQILEDVHIVLEAGMTLIVHPNTYHPAVGYFVLGDSLVVRDDGHELLCGTPRELFSTILQ